MDARLKILEDKLDLIVMVLGKTINGIQLTSDEKMDMSNLCYQAESRYQRSIELRKAFNEHLILMSKLKNLENDFPELKPKKNEE